MFFTCSKLLITLIWCLYKNLVNRLTWIQRCNLSKDLESNVLLSWDYKNKILFIYRYGAWCGSATRQSSEILVSVYSAQHISFNLLALENHTLLLGLNVFFSFLYYIQYCRFLVLLLSQFTATKPQEVHLCETFLPLKTFSDIFFWISLNHFLYFAYIIEIFNQIL